MKEILDEPMDRDEQSEMNTQMDNPHYKKARVLLLISLLSMVLLVVMAMFLFGSSYSTVFIIGSYIIGVLASVAGICFGIISFRIKDGIQLLKSLLLFIQILITIFYLILLGSLFLLKYGG